MKKSLLFVTALSVMLCGGCQMGNNDSSTNNTSSSETPVSSSSTVDSSSSSSSSSSSVTEQLNNYQLFEHIPGENQMFDYYYNYCPTIFEEDGVRHIYYCANKLHGNVTDYVAYRSGTKDASGRWVYSEIQYVLEPTADTWDSRHVCDPSVIKGEFKYNDEDYSYLMAYLGCVTSDNTSNEVGLAVSKTPAGPWIKLGSNPFCDYELNGNAGFQWGYGQPSLVSVDKKGQVLLFYTVGDGSSTYELVERWNLSDLNNPVMVSDGSKRVLTRGLKNLNGTQDYISNADFAYDTSSGRIYMIKDDHPSPEGANVSSSSTIYYLEEDFENPDFYPGYTLFNVVGDAWNEMDKIDISNAGFTLNHNNGLVTDPYGWTLSTKSIDCVYTAANYSASFWGTLGSYRLYQYTMEITE